MVATVTITAIIMLGFWIGPSHHRQTHDGVSLKSGAHPPNIWSTVFSAFLSLGTYCQQHQVVMSPWLDRVPILNSQLLG